MFAATKISSASRVFAALGLGLMLSACASREMDGSLSGSTSQRLVTHSIDDMARELPESFRALAGYKVWLNSYFLEANALKDYADQRLLTELEQTYGLVRAHQAEQADIALTVFYTSLATNRDNFGISIPLGFIPGVNETASLNVITLEKFHGIAEMYYYLSPLSAKAQALADLQQPQRGPTLQAVVRTDALGLPFITIPISNLDRHEKEGIRGHLGAN